MQSAHDTVALLHPGEMGATVGATLVAGGARVLWASEGRSAATETRARQSGLEPGGGLSGVVHASRAVVSVVPPHGALPLARSVAALGFRGVYVDGNAVSPETSREIGRVVEAAGARYVDGGIIGPAAKKRGTTRLYLSGPAAREVAPLLSAGPIDAVVLDAPNGAASALKMGYAAWTKGSQALLAAIRAFALAEGVEDALISEWKISIPEMPARSERAVSDNARKAWRFVGEMEEIARALRDVGLPGDFHDGAREVYARLADYKDTPAPPSVDEAIKKLLRR